MLACLSLVAGLLSLAQGPEPVKKHGGGGGSGSSGREPPAAAACQQNLREKMHLGVPFR